MLEVDPDLAQADEDTGQAVCAFVTLQGDLDGDAELEQEIRELGDVTTLRDPDVMEELQHCIRARGDED